MAHKDKKARIGFDYIHEVIDDHSRLAYAEVLDDEKGAPVATFAGNFAVHDSTQRFFCAYAVAGRFAASAAGDAHAGEGRLPLPTNGTRSPVCRSSAGVGCSGNNFCFEASDVIGPA